ncbi:putative short chain dehydrogenase/ reductase [Biscogniauxia mediterranea]|nr:putative short chain dehydrogenase/ reductase [Biscogniauxia mediterranea]
MTSCLTKQHTEEQKPIISQTWRRSLKERKGNFEDNMALENRLAIIAGGLGGIGSVTGKMLRAQGARLALLYAPFEASRTPELLRRGYGADAAADDRIRTYECDVASPESVAAAFAAIAADLAAINTSSAAAATAVVFPSILVNSAGYVSLSDMADTPPEETLKHLHVNVLGPMLCGQAFAKMYFTAVDGATGEEIESGSEKNKKKKPGGRIVSVSSQAAHVSLWRHGAYCASKAGLMGLTRSMASEWAPRGITANTVSPTVAWTDLGQRAWGDRDVADAFLRTVPTGRFVLPEEVAEAIVFLCQDSSGMINGADIKLDGGFTIR